MSKMHDRLATGHRREEAGRESDETVDLPCNIFGFPVVWTEEMPMFDIVLTDWQSYVRFKLKEEKPEWEAEAVVPEAEDG